MSSKISLAGREVSDGPRNPEGFFGEKEKKKKQGVCSRGGGRPKMT